MGCSLNIFYILYKESYFCALLNRFMKNTTLILFALCAASLFSCGKHEEFPRTEDKTINVSLGLPLAVESRTEVADDGSVIWVKGDKIALWAKAADNTYALNGNALSMLHYSSTKNLAYFSANMPAMSEGEYTYYASSPAPTTINGTKASYSIPTVQSGSNNMADILIATPTTAPQLIDGENNIDLKFSHILHAVKITIPEDGNLLGKPITKFKMTFPAAVAGDVTLDVSRPRISPTLTNSSNTITFEFPEPKQAGDSFWAVVYPSFLYGNITYVAYSNGYESRPKSFNINKQLLAGHITPMSLTIPQLNLNTIIRFTLGDNFLGEDVIAFKIKDSNGNILFNYGESNANNIYDTTFDGEWSVPSYSGQTLIAEFESNNAIVSNSFKMPTLTPYVTNVVPALTVPYLFYEDFSGITESKGFSETNRSTNPGGSMLDSYGLPGWSIARGSISKGLCVRVNCSFETALGQSEQYKGQVDTPALSAIKSGKTVKIKVVFNADTSADSTTCYVGNITNTGAVKAGTAISNGTSLSMSAAQVSYSDYFTERTVNVPNTTRASRIAFESVSQRSADLFQLSYYDHYIYIDNIRISISN